MWTCPSCGIAGNDDSHCTCPGCGFSKRSYPTLSGSAGGFTLKTSLVFGRKNLAQLVGDDSVYAADRQFEICPEGEHWTVKACAATRNATTLNDVEVTESGVPFKHGDIICISSRKDSSVRKAEIRISTNS